MSLTMSRPVPDPDHRPGIAVEKLAPGFALVLMLACMCVHADALAAEDAHKIDAAIESIRAEGATPFVAVAITTAGNMCHSGHYGEARQSPSSPPPKFHAASISKLLTATVIMQLQDEGKLSIDDPVSKYEPMFANSPIKLVDLLTHTSGLRDHAHADARHERQQVDSYIGALAKQSLVRRPGGHWYYSDAGYNLLGRVVERITGRPFADAMRERLLEPLGMHDSDFDIARISADSRLTAFDKRGRPVPHPWDIAFLPSSGLQTTAEDLAKFARAILTISASPDVRIPIDADALSDMTRVRIATEWDGIGQGLGWQIASSELGPQWRHAGSERGFEGLLTLYPDKGFAIVVLGNRADWPRFELEKKLSRLFADASTGCTGRIKNPVEQRVN